MFGLLPFSVGPWELVLVLAIVLIIWGPGKLPSVGKSVGKALHEFRRSRDEIDEINEEGQIVEKAGASKKES
ncbi:MAG: twin-arginine translocase TatA/TatE family subunit [Syntrophomonadaceae bacterium]|nr:twin-arginine translocase TatA/TatE family subunit [Syntrophomonadaceae bacterium]